MTVETKTRERPILFSGPMVRALLAGTKTQTRRVVKGVDPIRFPYVHRLDDGGWEFSSGNERCAVPTSEVPGTMCPFGGKGDRLWVREQLIAKDSAYGRKIAYAANGHYCMKRRIEVKTPEIHHIEAPTWPWAKPSVPSIHMPRWACRLTLEVTEVRVERLQEITHHDALAEGVAYDVSKPDGSPLARFQQLWESINGAGSWVLNPWVWVVSFKTIEGGAR